MSKNVVHRFDFSVICAGVLRLFSDQTLFNKYKQYLDEQWLYYNDNAPERKALREIIKISKLLDSEGNTGLFSLSYIESQILVKKIDEKQGLELRQFFSAWRANDDIARAMSDDGCFQTFLDYLKIIQIARISNEFYNAYQTGDVQQAATVMQNAIHKMNQINSTGTETLEPGEVLKLLAEDEKTNQYYTLYLGAKPLDDMLGGFEPQTLNIFVAPTGGGKTAMCHHLIRRCIEQRLPVWVGVLEDRKRSFVYKLMSCLTGIDRVRLKRQFSELTSQEMALCEEAQKKIDEFVKVEFIYGQDISGVNKIALEYDAQCDMRGKRKPVVNIVDYTGHVAIMSEGDKAYEKMRTAFGIRKNFALKYDKICFDFAQINREGTKGQSDERIITITDLAGSFDLAQVCDTIISLNRSSIDLSDSRAKLHVCKARDGVIGTTVSVKTEFHKTRYIMEDANTVGSPPREVPSAS